MPVINITKTRLNDPHMWFLGTNEQPGDYRSSGCTGCHVVYANDRNPMHARPVRRASATTATTQTADPTIPKDKSGHPLQHAFTRAIPSSQCMVCHMHQPNVFVNSFYGYTMWDYESDAPFMWPEKQKYPTSDEIREINKRNPEEAAIRGKWSDPEFLKNVSSLNPQLKDTQFADYHGHGWNFRAIFKRDRKGTLLDKDGKAVADNDPEKFVQSAQGRAPVVDPHGPRHALRRLPFRPGRPRQRPHLRRGRRGDRDRLRRLPRHRHALPQPVHDRPGRAARAAPTCRCCARRTAASASSGATASSTSARRSTPPRSGR